MGQCIGYARVSTDDQNLDLRLDALPAAGIDGHHLHSDSASSEEAKRKELTACTKALCEGDICVVWRRNRLGRSLRDLLRIVGDLNQKDVSFESLTQKTETGSAAGKLVFHVFAALAEFDRNPIRECTRAGIAAAWARGCTGARKPKLNDAQVKISM